MFERSKRFGVTEKTDLLLKNYKYEDIPFSTLASLFHNTALYTVQTDNLVRYHNIKKWPGIQQRCFDRSINATKAYFDYILQYLPKPKAIVKTDVTE